MGQLPTSQRQQPDSFPRQQPDSFPQQQSDLVLLQPDSFPQPNSPKQTSPTSSIEALPEEIIEHVAFFLNKAEVNYLRITCKKYYQWILPPVLRINNIEQYENLSKKNWTYLSELIMYGILLNAQQVKEILYCKKLERLEMSVMCTSNANYCLDFDKHRFLEIMFLKFYIKDFEGILMIKGSPDLRSSKVEIFRSNCETSETSPDKHKKQIILDFRGCSNLKS
jgi:hypothetical protein